MVTLVMLQDAVVARQYQTNLGVFKQTAQHWAAVYGGSSYQVPYNYVSYSLGGINKHGLSGRG